MTRIKFFFSYLVVSIAILGLLGCTVGGKSEEESLHMGERTIITFAYPGYLTAFNEANYQLLAVEFNDNNPDIWVELKEVSSQEMMDANSSFLDMVFDEEWGVDVIMNRGYAGLLENENILPLDNLDIYYPEIDLSEFYPLSLEMMTHDGVLLGIPFEIDLLVMYYNKDLFDQANVKYPSANWTRNDFLLTTDALRHGLPDTEIVFGGQIDEIIPFIYAHDGQLRDEDGYTLTNPLTIEAVQWYADLVLDHQVIPLPAQYETYQPEEKEGREISSASSSVGGEISETRIRWSEIGSIAQMAAQEGDVAIWANNLSIRGGTGGWQWDFDWGILPWPRDQKDIAISYPYAYFITKNTPDPAAAMRWIDFLTRQLPQLKGLPARRSVTEKAFELFDPQVELFVYNELVDLLENAIPVSYGEYLVSERFLGEAMIEILENNGEVGIELTKAQANLSDEQ